MRTALLAFVALCVGCGAGSQAELAQDPMSSSEEALRQPKDGTNPDTSYILLNSPSTVGADSGPRLGSTVSFTTHAAGLAGWEYPMVAIWCYQSGVLVYMQLDHPDTSFVLGGGSSDWLSNGGAADCAAFLYAYGSKGPRESIRTLAGTSFLAAAP